MFYRHDTQIVTLLLNVYAHLKDDWDFLLIICGDTGTGKSRGLGLNLLELWNEIILGRKVTAKTAKYIASDYEDWLKNFSTMDKYEMNIYDEGATALDSKEFATRISKDITRMFNVFRGKRFFSVIILPSFFHLNKYFRENRLRGCIWASTRGDYAFFTKKGITFLNAYNQGQKLKLMTRAYPLYRRAFPDYKGVMLKPYLKEKTDVMNKYVEDVNGDKKILTDVELFTKRVLKKRSEGMKQKDIIKKYGISKGTLQSIISEEK